MKPKRIQRQRTKGCKLPENCVYVGPFTKWSNPYLPEQCTHGAKGAVDAFRVLVESEEETIEEIKRELRSKDLCCFCKLDQPCHADILLELANQ